MADFGLGTALSIAGGLLGRHTQSEEAEDQRTLQRDFAQQGIQWRVADAKAAGLHPLFALGGNIPQPAGIAIGEDPLARSLSDMGQDMTRAARAPSGPQREAQELQLALLRSQIGETDARRELALSQAARNRQGDAASAPVISSPRSVMMPPARPMMPGVEPRSESDIIRLFGAEPGQLGLTDSVEVSASPVESPAFTDSSLTASVRPLWQRYRLWGDGPVLYLPSKDASEPLESISESIFMLGAVLSENLRRNPSAYAFLKDMAKPEALRWMQDAIENARPDRFSSPPRGVYKRGYRGAY